MDTKNHSKLLIVDDLPQNLQALNAIIRAEDRIVYQASSGEAALALLLEHEFALAILDVQMPGMNGFELAELMRGTEKTRHIPIVFVTAAANELSYAFKGYETGAVDFLLKPLDTLAVQSKVNVFVDLFQQRKEIQHQVVSLEKSREEQAALLQQLQTYQNELQRAIQMRDEFMSMVAHELRTPLNTLLLDARVRAIHLDRGNTSAFATDELRKMLERDGRQLHNMIRLIDDMLDVTRMRSGKLSIRPVTTELPELLEKIVSDLSPQIILSGSELVLSSERPITGFWDEFRIEQVIINLLTNALRYGEAKPITVKAMLCEQGVKIDVIDHGRGIVQEDITRIFEPFERGSGNKISGGLGLGLYISKQLIEAHHGSLSVQSTVGSGSTFTVVMPLLSA